MLQLCTELITIFSYLNRGADKPLAVSLPAHCIDFQDSLLCQSAHLRLQWKFLREEWLRRPKISKLPKIIFIKTHKCTRKTGSDQALFSLALALDCNSILVDKQWKDKVNAPRLHRLFNPTIIINYPIRISGRNSIVFVSSVMIVFSLAMKISREDSCVNAMKLDGSGIWNTSEITTLCFLTSIRVTCSLKLRTDGRSSSVSDA